MVRGQSKEVIGKIEKRVGVDLWAGTAAAAVVLTQSMAFGVALHEPYTGGGALGALAGLVAAVWLSLASSLTGATSALISAPTGPTLVLLGAIAGALSRAGLEGLAVLQALGVTIILAGLLQVLLGLSGGGRVIKLVPVPVIAGFMTGSGLLMIAGQVDPFTGGTWGRLWQDQPLSVAWAPVLAAVVTIACMHLGSRLHLPVPAPLLGLVAGTAAFHSFGVIVGAVPEADWLVGPLPGSDTFVAAGWWTLPAGLPWGLMLASAAALCMLASLDTLLTCVIADTRTGQRHDARRELVGQGAGHVLCGLSGALAGAGTTAATMVAAKVGGGRRAGFGCALVIACLVLVFHDVTSWVPMSVLAAIVVHVAIGLLGLDIFAWWRRRRTRADAMVALLVTAVTVGFDLMVAVGVGVLIMVVRYMADQIGRPVILRRVTARTYRSQRDRSARERAALDEHGDAVVLYELRGALFFGATDRLFEEMEPDLNAGRRIILSLRRVTRVDLTGVRLLHQMARRVHESGGELAFANVYRYIGLGRNVRKALRRGNPRDDGVRVRTFQSSDVAFEQAENTLLTELGVREAGSRDACTLAESELCVRMNEEEVRTLTGFMRTETVGTGTVVYRAGEHDGMLYVVGRGIVDIRLRTGRKQYSRLARIGPGMVFGGAGFNASGTHTASAIATEPCEFHILERASFERLTQAHPALALSLLDVLVGELGRRLRVAHREIYQLNQF